jgi:hypothetical protein
LRLPQRATKAEQEAMKARIDSVYTALKAGADFAELARKISQDPQSAKQGGLLPWIGPNQTLKEFEDVAYSLEVGSYSTPFLSTVGYHIIKLEGKRALESYDNLKSSIRSYLDAQGVQDKLALKRLESMAQHAGEQKTVEQILDEETERLSSDGNVHLSKNWLINLPHWALYKEYITEIEYERFNSSKSTNEKYCCFIHTADHVDYTVWVANLKSAEKIVSWLSET